MKHIYITCLLLLSTFALANTSQDNRAKTILDHTADAYRKAGGIHILFGGTQQGILLLKGECFYLECGGVKSWFDGKTQWSYVEQNEEVTVSHPHSPAKRRYPIDCPFHFRQLPTTLHHHPPEQRTNPRVPHLIL